MLKRLLAFRKFKAFSFLEILITLTLIVGLASGAVFVTYHLSNVGKVSAAKAKVASLQLKVQSEFLSVNDLPARLTDLKGETNETLIDPWGEEYVGVFFSEGDYYIISGGPDRMVETSIGQREPIKGDDIGIRVLDVFNNGR